MLSPVLVRHTPDGPDPADAESAGSDGRRAGARQAIVAVMLQVSPEAALTALPAMVVEPGDDRRLEIENDPSDTVFTDVVTKAAPFLVSVTFQRTQAL